MTGDILCDVDRERWQTTYRAVGDVRRLADLADPNALVPLSSSPVETDAVIEIEAGFNRPKSGRRLRTVLTRFAV